MKRVYALCAIVVMGAARLAAVEVSVEVASTDLLEESLGLEVSPKVALDIGESGLSVEFSWTIPLVPEATAGALSLEESYTLELDPFALTLTNSNSLDLSDDLTFEGALAVEGTWSFLAAGLETGYWPEFALDAWLGASTELALGALTLGLGIEQGFTLYSEAALGDLEGSLSLGIPAGPVSLGLELKPVLYGVVDGFGLSIAASAALEL